ncbi:MAG: NAD(P)/FAD-dependent oxidoreductase [Leptospiraceae bacterium]|nr:NAD(P)/FAD-dependent oxidoreductase [Leptospiraceae bacterium]
MAQRSRKLDYDTIFIGSGIGTQLAAAALVRLCGERVLILERHFTPGGFTHTFKRKNRFFWDVGIHYIGDLAEGSILHRLFHFLSGGSLKWQKMPKVFDKFIYPDLTFGVPDDPEEFARALIRLFPEEESAIHKYLTDIRKTNTWFGRHIGLRGRAPFTENFEGDFVAKEGFNPRHSVAQYLDQNFRDRRLKGLLVSQWGNYGLPPQKASFLIHAAVVQHYFHGGYYPLGGSHRIFDSLKPILEKTQSMVLTAHEVKEILLEKDRAVGVRAVALREPGKPEKILRSKKIFSNAGAYTTYLRLLPEKMPFADALRQFYTENPVVSNVTLYLGLKTDPRRLGFGGENYWIYSSYDHDANFARGADWVLRDEPVGAYLSFPSLKNGEAKSHTAEIIAFTDYRIFERWKDAPWRRRGEEYNTLKERISQALLRYVEKFFPGFCELVEYQELSTPITTEYFTGHPLGGIYGVPCVPERFLSQKSPWCNPRTPIENLYLTGADASTPGIAGAMMGAVAALSQLPQPIRLTDLLRAADASAA